MTPKGQIIKGYKATDENMCCRGFQFEIGKWYEHNGELSLCKSGFHFCEYPSGPWAYYGNGRLFKCEAEFVELSNEPGAGLKHVAKRIRLIEEIIIGGDKNTGYGNAGDRNTGNWNTGSWNTGNWNTGNLNTGNWNTGNWNTGDGNTGDGNTGDRNTGNLNTGNLNTGNRNTGSWNTGDGNQGDHHSGCLNYGAAKYYIFNREADKEKVDFNLVYQLSELLLQDNPIDPTPFLSLPNASEKVIKELHKAHIEARKALHSK